MNTHTPEARRMFQIQQETAYYKQLPRGNGKIPLAFSDVNYQSKPVSYMSSSIQKLQPLKFPSACRSLQGWTGVYQLCM